MRYMIAERPIEERLESRNSVEILEKLNSHLQLFCNPDGKKNHKRDTLRNSAIMLIDRLEEEGLGKITFIKLKEKLPERYETAVLCVKEGRDKYGFTV